MSETRVILNFILGEIGRWQSELPVGFVSRMTRFCETVMQKQRDQAGKGAVQDESGRRKHRKRH